VPDYPNAPGSLAYRTDPLVIYDNHRDELISELVRATRIRPDSAEHFVCAWEAEARRRGLDQWSAAWWAPALTWIVDHRWMANRGP